MTACTPVLSLPTPAGWLGLGLGLASARRAAAGSATAADAAARAGYGAVLVQARQSDDLEAERQLCERAKTGDRAALGTLLRRHGPRLYRSVLLPRLGNVALAEEALSATYIKVVEHFAQFNWQSVGVYPWLRVVAMRVALDQIRARKRELLFEPADLEREIDAGRARRSRRRSHRTIRPVGCARARRAPARSHQSRATPRPFGCVVLEERPREEAAQELGVSVGTFDVVLHRAMAALRKALAAAEGVDNMTDRTDPRDAPLEELLDPAVEQALERSPACRPGLPASSTPRSTSS